jgi:uncharacterized protein YfaS (alpha-2-macroglobulin family)
MKHRIRRAFALALALIGLTATGAAQKQSRPTETRRPAGAEGTVIVPEKFLRRWDPVTIFFARDAGPSAGGPEDHPERVVKVSPEHPGAYQWLDARTLQFRPAEPWPPLARSTWAADGKSATLTTLMEAPLSTIPAAESEGLESVEAITLTFAEPLDAEALRKMVTIELRPLPGVGGGPARWLNRDDFDVKSVERHSGSENATYVVALKHPLPLGQRVRVHFRLALDDTSPDSFAEVRFSTSEPFRVTTLGAAGNRYPVTPQGSRYTRDQAINGGSENRSVLVEFSARPKEIGPLEARSLVRFTPAVPELSFTMRDKTLEIAGKFAWDTVYRVTLVPAPLTDKKGRRLDMSGESEVFVYFPRKPAYLKWGAGQGIVERLGPQMVPVEGRAQERVDLRIHSIDAVDRNLWPFVGQGVTVDESTRPPGPGEEQPAHTDPLRFPSAAELARRIRTLGSPPVSAIVALPLRKEGGAATFGLDLSSQLAFLSGKSQPGTYLVGLRRLDSSTERSWMRVQVTDLTLTTFEEASAVRFVVTSLSTGKPVTGAKVRVEGALTVSGSPSAWTTLHEGTTDPDGSFTWQVPGHDPAGRRAAQVRRIVVQKETDLLVLDPTRAPDGYADNQWSPAEGTWLQWTYEALAGRAPQTETLCHIFTERPVYRPEEEVYIKGYLRLREKGKLSPVVIPGFVVVQGPGDLKWRYPVQLTPAGSFHHTFKENKLPTGVYSAHLENKDKKTFGRVTWRMEAYRLPTFEVQLHAPDQVPLDREFDVSLTATYYAGGRVAGRPVEWRVTQFPFTWTPKKREGYQYSSDGRFSRTERFESTPRLTKNDTTSEEGAAALKLNPAVEPTAQPRSYVVEATVTGADDQTVTATRQVIGLPPFVLGVKLPRYLEHATKIEPEIIALAPDGELLAGQEVTVRLLHRQWHSNLRASDFSEGVARYLTDVVDEKVLERKVTSGKQPIRLELPIERAGVYVVELSSRDRLGRAQVIAVDLYAGGKEPVTWARPVTRVFSVATDKDNYDPGASAAIVLKSPFQKADALAVIEAPEGNQYKWVKVEAGAATLHVPILSSYVPRVPVHFVLMRGRLPGTSPQPGSSTDLGKPATMAATAWLSVNPVENTVKVALSHPEKARPGEKIEIKIRLSDPRGKPLPGEVTLWLVDASVLALGREQRLDPLPDFISSVRSRLVVHDTRDLSFGMLPFAESPGGEEAGKGAPSLLDRATIRKLFKTVPYYNPAIQVGPDGSVTVTVQLPDNLTNFKIRAKAASGPDRFGYATSQVAVRLPVIVQPALPRFVRPGDHFTAAAIARIVEGGAGPGSAQVRAEGVAIKGETKKELTWVPNRAERIEFEVDVPNPPYTEDGKLAYGEVTFRMGVERASDKATDAFEVKLPIRDDCQRLVSRTLVDLSPGVAVPLPDVTEPARPGTIKRSVLVSTQPGLVRMAAGLDFFVAYPYACTEQRISRARAEIALKGFRALLRQPAGKELLDRPVRETLAWIPTVVDGNGLVAYWPGTDGSVSLTAWTVQFLDEAREAGYTVDAKVFDTLIRSLEQALRSDYSRFLDGEAYAERVWALTALADAGRFNAAYAAELARKTQFLDLEGVADVLLAFARSKAPSSSTTQELVRDLWSGLVIRLYQGREIYGGLQERRQTRNGLILPSETRTLAEVTRAIARTQPGDPRFPLLVNALVTLGRDDGWGSTNANAEALLALSETLKPPFAASPKASVTLQLEGQPQTLQLGPEAPVAAAVSTRAGAGQAVLKSVDAGGKVVLRAEISYVPAADGSQVAPQAAGFVVSREMLKISKTEGPPQKMPLAQAGTRIALAVGDVIEDHIQVVNPKDRHYVAITAPLAAGLEPLNPNLATAPREAHPTGKLTLSPTYVEYLDDRATFYYNTLPKGTYDFFFRTRATVPGGFTQPPALAEMMYDGAVRGNSAGARVEVAPKKAD